MDFKSAEELLGLCREHSVSIADIMRGREAELAEQTPEAVEQRMRHSLSVMEKSIREPLDPVSAHGGHLIGGEARKLETHRQAGDSICGNVLSSAVIYSQAVLEVNASMGVIVAAPTAGSSGVIPGVLFALQEEFSLGEKTLLDGLWTAGAIGYLVMRNASVAGAEAGCQAEVGSASAMAAAMAVAMLGGTSEQCIDGASIAFSNLLGLVCDPVAGLVEVPCQTRNALGAANALLSGEIALSGIRAQIPFTEMVEAMYSVGKGIAPELRETALGGCAATETGRACAGRIFRSAQM